MICDFQNIDCLEYMREIPDRHFDLTIADPPYGIGKDWEKRNKLPKGRFGESQYDNKLPVAEVFREIQRVSKHWIIWGWNYFTDVLSPTNYLIVWDKMSNSNQVFQYSKCEIAGTDIRIPCNLVSIPWDGYRMGEETGKKKIHPHQKPLALFRWLLDNYGYGARAIFDPFAGSASLAVVCKERNLDYFGCEIDKAFFKAAVSRINGEYYKPPKRIDFQPCLAFTANNEERFA